MEFTIYFADRKMNILGNASTKSTAPVQIAFDEEEDNVEVASAVYELTLDYSKEVDIDQLVDVGFYAIFVNEDGEGRFYTIIDFEKDVLNRTVDLYMEDGGLDLINDEVGKYQAAEAHTIDFYINKFTYDSGFEIGVNEIGNSLSRKLKWEGDSTVTKRLDSIATQFDHAELNFSFEIKGMTITKKYINIYKKRGKDVGTRLKMGTDIHNIVVSRSIANLATALNCEGGTPEGKDKPITLKGYKYDDGRFYVDGTYLKDRESLKVWSRYISPDEFGTDEGHLVKRYSYDTTSQSELCNRAVSELTKASQVEQNFEVDIAVLPKHCRVGDTVYIVDNDEKLYLQARILKLTRSRSRNEHKAVLGDYLIKESGINAKVQELADKIESIKGLNSSFLWIRYADDELGNGFSAKPAGKKYMAVKSVVNEPVPSDDPADYDGLWALIQGSRGIDGTNKYIWVKYADNVSGGGMSDNPVGKAYIGMAYNKDTPTASRNPSDYNWFLAKGDSGKDGKTPYFYIAWSDSLDGKTGFTIDKAKAGTKGYLGTYSSINSVQSTNPTDYAWVKLAGAFENELTELQNTIDKVNKVVVQFEEPAKKNNTLWWKTESRTSDKIVGYYVCENNKWIPQTIEQSMLNIVELNAVEINGSTITGSSFLNHWNKGGIGREGVMRIEDGSLSSDYTTRTGGKGSLILDEAKLLMQTQDSYGNQTSSLQISPQQMQITTTGASGAVGGIIRAEALNDYGWKTIRLSSGYVAAENNPPAYKKTVNLDGTTTIKWRGQVTTKSGTIPAGGSVFFATGIPIEARPKVTEFSLGATSTANTGVRIAVLTDGRFQLWTQSAVGYVVLSGFTYEAKS